MIFKLLSIVALMELVQSDPQILKLDKVPVIGGIIGSGSGTADKVINTGKKIADTVVESIKNFNDFKTTFKKKYVDKAEELLREKIFNVSLARIDDHNKLFEQGNVSWWSAMNFFGDWTHDEYLKFLGTKTLNSTNGTYHRHTRQTSDSHCEFPVEKDWRKDGAVTQVKDQRGNNDCGSCWAFAESHIFIKNGKLPDFSEQQLVDCSSENLGCNGGWVHRAYEYIMENGIVTDDEYPYVGKSNGEGRCNKFRSGQKISGYNFIASGNEAELKDAICRSGPVAIGVDASSPEFSVYKGGMYADTNCSSAKINHAMLVVGYGVDEDTKEPYYLIKNSWGTSNWGEEGYMRLRRDFNNLCGIASQAFYPVS